MMMDVKKIQKDYIYHVWALFNIAGLLIYLATYVIEMPYEKWLSENITASVSTIIYILLGIMLLVATIPKIPKFISCIGGTLFVICLIISESASSKAPFINESIAFIFIVLYIATKIFLSRMKVKNTEQ
jgi:uncharacterized membrane protein SirB2